MNGGIWFIMHEPYHKAAGPQRPQIFGTYICRHRMTQSNHIYMAIKLDERKKFYMVDDANFL